MWTDVSLFGKVSSVRGVGDGTVRDRRERDERIFEAVEKHGYTQREVADHLGLRFTSVSRIMKARGVMSRK
jgi:hypothetical protein